jgi:fibronectin-binding autotransporter adhesin
MKLVAFILGCVACVVLAAPAGAGIHDERDSAGSLFGIQARSHHAVVRAKPAGGTTLCVGAGAACYSTIQAALTAAHDGDTIRLAPGTYAGGITIDKSVDVVGGGAAATTIRGGGPVLTIGTFFAATEPTVTISGVTITGGTTDSSDQANLFFGVPTIWAIGGGVYIPPSADFNPGATVTIVNSVVTHNRAAPTSSFAPAPGTAPFWPVCPGGYCQFAGASGGGIADDGTLNLIGTSVTDNEVVGPVASDSDGGGIWMGFSGGSLTVSDSVVSGNRASASDPNGRFAEGGGLFTEFGDTVTIENSRVDGNAATLTSTFPYFLPGGGTLEIATNSGGIHMGNGGTLTIIDTTVDGNTVSGTDLAGEPEVFDAGLCDCGDSKLMLRSSSVSGNRLTATMGTNVDVYLARGFSAGGAFEFDGPATVSNVRVLGNSADVTSPSGAAIANGAVPVFYSDITPAVFSESVISGNTVTATSDSGSAVVLGAGLLDAGTLALTNDQITNNTGAANAPTGSGQGAGIWTGVFPGGPPASLSIDGTNVVHNALTGSAGVALQGGGIFAAIPVLLANSRVVANTPDDCFGAAC